MRICALFGVTRQAFYQHNCHQEEVNIEVLLIISEVKRIREQHKAMGTRKLYEKLYPFMLEHQIKMGRDVLFDCLSNHKLLIRKRKRKISTTMSYHRFHKYPNLIKNKQITASNQLYVSDITYWKIESGFAYISFITDVFSHKIVGYQVAETLETIESKVALEMALQTLSKEQMQELIHHSDRGVQYCSIEYVKLLQDNGIKISMTETSEPTDNAVAERINGILKNEYLCFEKVENIAQAKINLKEAVKLYNQDRPHMSIGNLTPSEVHQSGIKTERLWKNYYQQNKRKEQTMV